MPVLPDNQCRLDGLESPGGEHGYQRRSAWNPAVLEQRIARAHRMGQRRPVQVFVLVTEGTIEENLLATLSAKHDLAMAALDADSDVTQVDLVSGIEELRRRLEVLLARRRRRRWTFRSRKKSAAGKSNFASIAIAWRPPADTPWRRGNVVGRTGRGRSPDSAVGDDRCSGSRPSRGVCRGRSLGQAAAFDYASRPPGAGQIGPDAGDPAGPGRGVLTAIAKMALIGGRQRSRAARPPAHMADPWQPIAGIVTVLPTAPSPETGGKGAGRRSSPDRGASRIRRRRCSGRFLGPRACLWSG